MSEFPAYFRFLGDVPGDVLELAHPDTLDRLHPDEAQGVRWLLEQVRDLDKRLGKATDAYDSLRDELTRAGPRPLP